MRGSKLQIRCRLILLIFEHPIQHGIRKGTFVTDRQTRTRTRTEWRILGSRIVLMLENCMPNINWRENLPCVFVINFSWISDGVFDLVYCIVCFLDGTLITNFTRGSPFLVRYGEL